MPVYINPGLFSLWCTPPAPEEAVSLKYPAKVAYPDPAVRDTETAAK